MDRLFAGRTKELVKQTGCSILECRAALEESGGDVEAAKQILRSNHRPRYGIMDDTEWFRRDSSDSGNSGAQA